MPQDMMMMQSPSMDELYREEEPARAESEVENETLIAKSALPRGVKEGDRVVFIVTGDYGDEVGLAVAETETKTDADEMKALEESEY